MFLLSLLGFYAVWHDLIILLMFHNILFYLYLFIIGVAAIFLEFSWLSSSQVSSLAHSMHRYGERSSLSLSAASLV
jgi:hypothetical protein